LSALLPKGGLLPLYVLVGDEIYFHDRFRQELRAALPPEALELGWYDEDLAATPLEGILDQARTPSLMCPQQVFWVSGAGELFARGAKKHGDFPANIRGFVQQGPPAVVVLIAGHIHLPAERARMALEDKGKLQRLQETLGDLGGWIECARPAEAQAAAMARQRALELGHELPAATAQSLAALVEGNLALLQREVEKLGAHAGPGAPIEAAAIPALVASARAGSAYDLAQKVARGHRAAALACLRAIWADEGDGGAIGLLFQLSRIFSMALILQQEGVRDRSGLYRALPEGMRPPAFAAEAVLAVSRAMRTALLRQAILGLHAADVELRSSTPSPILVFERLVTALTPAVSGAAPSGSVRVPQPLRG